MVKGAPDLIAHDGLHQHVAEILRRQIAGGVLKPGDRLVEMRIARQLGVSQTPVREALRLLEREGLVEHRPRRGVYVTHLSAHDIDEIYSVRCALESLAIRRAMRYMTPDDLTAIERIVAAMEATARDGDADGLVELASRFHEAICVLSRHGRLLHMWRSIVAQTSHVSATAGHLYVDHLPAEAAYHRDVLNAMRTGDAGAAERAIQDHFHQAGHQFLRTALARGVLAIDGRAPQMRDAADGEWALFLEPENMHTDGGTPTAVPSVPSSVSRRQGEGTAR